MTQLTTPGLAGVFDLTATGDGRHTARVDETWQGWSGPHGGVVAALLVEVALRAAAEPLPVRAVDLRFLGRPATGVLEFAAAATAVGRNTAVVDVRAEQGGVVVAAAAVTLGRTVPSEVAAYAGTPAPEVPAPEECAEFRLPPEIVPAGAHFEIRPASEVLPLTGSAERELRAWVVLRPEPGGATEFPIDAAVLAILADALPPALFPALRAPLALPTVAFSLHLHAEPVAAQPVLVTTVNASTSGGWSVDDTELRAADGRLLATARQTRRVLG
ncbi:acyl-CoA thioesterase [Nocardia asteroides]|uniref:acyl-CoA thioesterase n=1 Tax=Nocardia asteroides TaxID=1824 RepID=UPI001E4F83F2|nr:thioesterase family protein [Nocardia asteroides]UGT63499.1 thioesterase family protein [Nocardia asteroides]